MKSCIVFSPLSCRPASPSHMIAFLDEMLAKKGMVNDSAIIY